MQEISVFIVPREAERRLVRGCYIRRNVPWFHSYKGVIISAASWIATPYLFIKSIF